MKAIKIVAIAVIGAIAGHALEEPVKNAVRKLREGGKGGLPETKSAATSGPEASKRGEGGKTP